MKMPHLAMVAAVIAAIAVDVPGGAPAAMAPALSAVPVRQAEYTAPVLSVMTYNVEGLPWPVAFGRTSALEKIGRHLARLRKQGVQPHIVLLQEAFVSEAKALGTIGGYPYVALGPQPADASPSPTASLDRQFRANATWRKGEGDGKWLDSGLVILSDFPIVETARMAFPEDACAGFDCLSAKGALLARIKVPGMRKPVVLVDTHLNSRHASGVSVARADTAYAWQAEALQNFVSMKVDPQSDVILAGDFNIGHDPKRLAAARKNGGFLPGAREAIALMSRPAGVQSDADLAEIQRHAKDKEYFRPGAGSKLELVDVEVPFGIAAGGLGLSDHIGFVAKYALN